MYTIIDTLNFSGSVLNINEANGNLIVFDSNFNITIIESQTLKTKNILSMKKDEEIHPYSKKFAINGSNQVAIPKKNRCYIFDIDEKKIVKTIDAWHKLDIEVSHFSRFSNSFILGGMDGRVTVYSLPDFHLMDILPPRAEYVSNISYSKDGSRVICNYYDKNNVIYDIFYSKVLSVFKTKEVVEHSRFFEDDTKLFLITRDGMSHIYSLEDMQIISSRDILGHWPTKVEIGKCGIFALIGTRNGNLHIVDLRSNKISAQLDFGGIGITAMKLTQERIYLGFADGQIKVLDYTEGSEAFRIALKVENFQEVKRLADENIFLKLDAFYLQKLKKGWEKAEPGIIQLLENQKIEEAVKIADPFLEDAECEARFNEISKNIKYVVDFKTAIKDKRIDDAYLIAEQRPEIKKLKIYLILEDLWKKTFTLIKKRLELNPNYDRAKLQDLVEDFLANSDNKRAYELLLKNSKIYIAADELIKKRAFEHYFKLTLEHTFLQESSLYRRTMDLGYTILDRVTNLELEEKIDEAKEGLFTLKGFLPIASLIERKKELLEAKSLLLEAYLDGDREKIFSLALKYPELVNMRIFKEIRDEFAKAFQETQNFILLGYTEKFLDKMQPYLYAEIFKERIFNSLKICTLHELQRRGTATEQINWKKSIKNYLEVFGDDEELREICEKHETKAIYDEVKNSMPQGIKEASIKQVVEYS